MATAQKQRNSVGAVVFPKKIATEQQSLMLVKRLLAVAVSCITYLRGIFPESAYGTRYMDDVCVKILREDKNSPGSTQLVKWMLGCYDALQKKYLRQIVLAVYTQTEDPQTVTECYHFKFKYTHNGPLLDFGSKDRKSESPISCADTKKASILLIRKIYILMQNLSPLPSDVCLTMKLLYYDEGTASSASFEDPVLGNEVQDKNRVNISEAQGKNSAPEGEAGGIQTPPRVSNTQVDHLTRKTSELIVSESRTRSGKIFQSCIVHQAELSSSQEVLPKRRKLSEPKEQF
ncbi:HORMA domain-containing protein 1 [Onychostruthus taczanowskii]|uniref:HORMA domain-containing protein 1 n=1 Tax=Onychostruthus taczanowskii TaxID=356909 RepID=UPI001B80D7C3|nr:HORMA domain-containing protein 1 [Onychostruthus taczanowskii]